MDIPPVIEAGIVEYLTRTNSPKEAPVAAEAYRRVRDFYSHVLTPEETCRIAFPTVVINTGGKPRQAFAAVTDSRFLVAWQQGFPPRRASSARYIRSSGTATAPAMTPCPTRGSKSCLPSVRNERGLARSGLFDHEYET